MSVTFYPLHSTFLLFSSSLSLSHSLHSPPPSTLSPHLLTYINSLRAAKEVLSQEDKVELVVFWQCCWRSDWIVSSVVVHECHRNCVEYNNHAE